MIIPRQLCVFESQQFPLRAPVPGSPLASPADQYTHRAAPGVSDRSSYTGLGGRNIPRWTATDAVFDERDRTLLLRRSMAASPSCCASLGADVCRRMERATKHESDGRRRSTWPLVMIRSTTKSMSASFKVHGGRGCDESISKTKTARKIGGAALDADQLRSKHSELEDLAVMCLWCHE